jgi:flavorubredoxin
MKKMVPLYENGSHSWHVVARDPTRPNHLIDTNEYVISDGDMSVLTDPGGQEVFPAVFAAISEGWDPRKITTIFSSHQDPDVISSLAMWLEFNPKLKCHTSWLWCTFIPHFGGDEGTMVPVPDEGGVLPLGAHTLQMFPAHFLHSPGNLQLWDPDAGILFTGDVGAALLPSDAGLFVTDFATHIKSAEGFHQRWMPSASAKNDWCRRARALSPKMLCPQHGAIYKGDDVNRFLDWFEALEVGLLKKRK